MTKAAVASIAPARREQLSLVMRLAWQLFRAEERGPNPRTFADALAGAWRFLKRMAAEAVKPMTGHVRLNGMVRSPIARGLTGARFAGAEAASRGYTSSRFGR